MKNIILGLLIGVSIMLSVNAITTSSTITTKPAQPRAWVIDVGSAEVIQNTILKFSKQGYIVHSLETSGYNSYRHSMVVMYKYY